MDVATARWLVSEAARPWLEQAGAEADPSSLGAATRLRRSLDPDRAAAVLDQVVLRQRAHGKLPDLANRLFLTRSGLEQATRLDVARWRAARLRDAGVTALTDAGAGLGIDAYAAVEAGLAVRAIERDVVTATFLAANLEMARAAGNALAANLEAARAAGNAAPHTSGPTPEAATTQGVRSAEPAASAPAVSGPMYEVIVGDVERAVAGDREAADRREALFLDPSRRTPAGRSWRVEDLSPPWAYVERLLTTGGGVVVAKLGPGLAQRLIPPGIEAIWVSHHGDLVELGLWRWPSVPGAGRDEAPDGVLFAPSDQWSALLLPSGERLFGATAPPFAGPLGPYIWEPDPAVIRARAVGRLAELLGAHPVADHCAYLTGDRCQSTRFATRFEVLQVLPYEDKAIRAWVRRENIGQLEIKTRGLDLDPATWRRRLGLRGRGAATLICTPTVRGAVALVVRRAALETIPPAPA
jgi:hypothetical protein